MADKAEIARCIEALNAVELIRQTYGSSQKGAELVHKIAEALASHRSKMGRYGGICQQAADAIHRGILNQEPPGRPET